METIISVLRVLINDTSGTTYSDSDLEKIVSVAAMFVQQEMLFSQTYAVDFVLTTITPDPTDYAFISFVALKSAIILAQGELKDSASNSFRIVDGPSSIDTTSSFKSRKDFLDTLLNQYAKDKLSFSMDSSIGGYRAVITTPTTNGNIY